MWVHRLSFLPIKRQPPNPSLLHIKSPHPQRNLRIKKERKRKRQRGPPAKQVATAGLKTLRTNEEGFEEDQDDEDRPPSPQLYVFFDVQANATPTTIRSQFGSGQNR